MCIHDHYREPKKTEQKREKMKLTIIGEQLITPFDVKNILKLGKIYHHPATPGYLDFIEQEFREADVSHQIDVDGIFERLLEKGIELVNLPVSVVDVCQLAVKNNVPITLSGLRKESVVLVDGLN